MTSKSGTPSPATMAKMREHLKLFKKNRNAGVDKDTAKLTFQAALNVKSRSSKSSSKSSSTKSNSSSKSSSKLVVLRDTDGTVVARVTRKKAQELMARWNRELGTPPGASASIIKRMSKRNNRQKRKSKKKNRKSKKKNTKSKKTKTQSSRSK